MLPFKAKYYLKLLFVDLLKLLEEPIQGELRCRIVRLYLDTHLLVRRRHYENVVKLAIVHLRIGQKLLQQSSLS